MLQNGLKVTIHSFTNKRNVGPQAARGDTTIETYNILMRNYLDLLAGDQIEVLASGP